MTATQAVPASETDMAAAVARRPVFWALKRAFDFSAALAGLIALSPVLLLVALAIKASSRGPVFFRQERLGRNFQPFRIYKFRTMVADAPKLGGPLTAGTCDLRITQVGRFLRATKLDELPQLINVLNGEMSLVGPRPEVARFVEMFRDEYRDILCVRPGVTDPASLKYRHEAALLDKAANPEEEYVRNILPDKIAMSRDYIRRASWWYDLSLIVRTLLSAIT